MTSQERAYLRSALEDLTRMLVLMCDRDDVEAQKIGPQVAALRALYHRTAPPAAKAVTS